MTLRELRVGEVPKAIIALDGLPVYVAATAHDASR
jgi:hypothetical protein